MSQPIPVPHSTRTPTEAAPEREVIDFGSLRIAFDARVLRPRAWTTAQSEWARELLDELPPGPVLELCAGAGQIGLLGLVDADRELVSVDLDPTAGAFTALNARTAKMSARVEVRVGRGPEVLEKAERFALVIADPPWVPRDETGRFPEDPLLAIDGGADGLSVARECVDIAEAHLLPAGVALLQLGSMGQVEQTADELATRDLLRITETRQFSDRGVLLRLDRADPDDGT